MEFTFKNRGESVSRLETFCDAAFAFALTMLVISIGSIPNNYQELILALKKVPSFAVSFTSIVWFWIGHRKWSRRYGLEDNTSIIFSLLLVFIVLVYVYPLRLIFSALFAWITGGWLPSEFQIAAMFELADLFIIYGLGFFALCGTLTLLYFHVFQNRKKLDLSDLEQIKTNEEVWFWSAQALVGLLSALFAMVMPGGVAVYAGFIYILLALVMPFIAIHFDKKIKKTTSISR